MPNITFNKVAAPSAPAASTVDLYYDSADNNPHAIDHSNDRILAPMAINSYRQIKVTEIFNGTTSYTPSTGCRALYVECIGAGGGGGGGAGGSGTASAGGGGGGGGYSATFLTTVKSSYVVAVGLAGTGATAGANTGGTGGDTTFDSPSVCTAKGGVGGAPGTLSGAGVTNVQGAGGAGGASASGVGDIKLDGSPGGTALDLNAHYVTGQGGNSAGICGGGAIGTTTSPSAGNAADQYGGGGSGGLGSGTPTNEAGGAGANGLLRITEFG